MADELGAEERERRRHAFALTASASGAVGPALDPQLALSPRADELRANGIDELLLARELKRGIVDSKPGPDHQKYLRLASRWLGYPLDDARPGSGLPEQAAGAATLAAAVAGALHGARDLLSERERKRATIADDLGSSSLRIVDAEAQR